MYNQSNEQKSKGFVVRYEEIHWTDKNASINKLNGYNYTLYFRGAGINLGKPFNDLSEVFDLVISEYKRRRISCDLEKVRIALRPSSPNRFSVMYYQEDGIFRVLGYVVKGKFYA